jgi:hypothetical protein
MTAYNETKESGYSNEIDLKALAAKVTKTMAQPRPDVDNLRITVEEVK